MEKTTTSGFIRLMHWLTKLVFGLHLTLVIFLTAFNYFDLLGYLHGEKPFFTVRGEVHCIAQNWKPLRETEEYLVKDRVGVNPVYLMKNSGFARLDYTDFNKAFSFRNVMITILDIAHLWIWLVLSFQLMKIISSLRASKVFDLHNMLRLRIIALVFGVAPILEAIRNNMFAGLLKSIIEIPNYFILSKYNFMMYYGIGIMLFIFVLAEIFKYGLQLKQENDLTI